MDKRILNYLVIILLTLTTFWWTFSMFHKAMDWTMISIVIVARILSSSFLFRDYSLSWSKVTQKTFLIKSVVYVIAFLVYLPIFRNKVPIAFLVSELFSYLFIINFSMYLYYFYTNRSGIIKTKNVVIYGAGKAGLEIESEFRNSKYRVKYFIDDNSSLQNRSIDNIPILSKDKIKEIIGKEPFDLLVIAIPSAQKGRINEIYEELNSYFIEIKILPALDEILRDRGFSSQLKDISIKDLLAREPQDLDKKQITFFLKNKKILITGAGGSIGSELARKCVKFGAKQLILVDHSEYNLYQIDQEISKKNTVPVLQSVVNRECLDRTFETYKPDIVIHAAAYKHVPLVEANIKEAINNNVIGTKNVIDLAIKHKVQKLVLISTDKAVRPTNVMGTTKRICELYAQNSNGNGTEIVAVRFGNVLGSSGSVIPKFKKQIEMGQNLTVTHPDITRYFMLIPEACELVLQAGAIGHGGEIFILDMGDSIKIVDLAQKMINLSGRDDIKIEFTGLRPGEKLYEELLIDDSIENTRYKSITIAKPTKYDIDKLNSDIENLKNSKNEEELLANLKKIVPEFNHQKNENEPTSNK